MQLIVVILWIVITRIGLYKMFEKAGEAGWKALIPIYNKIVWADIVGRPRWKVALLLIPIVNIFVLVGMVIDLVNSFSKWVNGIWMKNVLKNPTAEELMEYRQTNVVWQNLW